MKSKTITIKIDCNNDAFNLYEESLAYEVSDILSEIIGYIEDRNMKVSPMTLKDSNGNTCGSVKLTGF